MASHGPGQTGDGCEFVTLPTPLTQSKPPDRNQSGAETFRLPPLNGSPPMLHNTTPPAPENAALANSLQRLLDGHTLAESCSDPETLPEVGGQPPNSPTTTPDEPADPAR